MRCFRSLAALAFAPGLLFAQTPVTLSQQSHTVTVVDEPSVPAVAANKIASGANGATDPAAGTRSYSDDPRYTVSVSSLAAPEKARKAFNKGEEEARKGRWQFASDYFKKAIDMYPRYALAWLELGRVHVRQSSFVDAQQCFRQAVTEDSKLLDGYVELANVGLQQQNWKDVADASDHLIQLAPGSSAQYWLLNAAAYYNLGKLDQAEASITRGLDLDSRHQFAEMEYLDALILGSKKDYKAAAEHMTTYLQLAPNAPDHEAAQNLLAGYQYQLQRAEQDQ
ncbi:MAG TPA: tetratricopeptide repeat protein [Terriglobales bacterium]|nr:tetratricopeptide repeat protein [Terriglobales bacterium]